MVCCCKDIEKNVNLQTEKKKLYLESKFMKKYIFWTVILASTFLFFACTTAERCNCG